MPDGLANLSRIIKTNPAVSLLFAVQSATAIFREGASMRRIFLFLLIFISWAASLRAQQKLSTHWEELTADDFLHAIDLSKGTCILPIGILEKHGPHLPLGTDLLNVRYASLHAAEKEFAVVFP
jgi:creatinine amidohydrolase